MKFKDIFFSGLNDYLANIPRPILGRGIDIYEEDSIDSITYDVSTKQFTAIVYGSDSYYIALQLNYNHTSIIATSCDCHYDEVCKHIVAVAYSIMVSPEDVSFMTTRVKKTKAISTKLSGDSKSKSHTINGLSLEEIAADLGELRTIGSIRRNVYRNETILRHFLESDGKVKSILYKTDWGWNRSIDKITHVATFSITDTAILCNCEACDYTKNKLCAHTHESLAGLLYRLQSSDGETLEYTKIMSEFAESENLTLEVVAELFQIEITKRGLAFLARDTALMVEDSIFKLNAKYNIHSQEKENLVLDTLTQSLEKGEALAWSSRSGIYYHRMVFLLTGKTNKNGDKLSSHIEVIEQPTLLSSGAKQAYEELGPYNFKEQELNKLETDYRSIGKTIQVLRKNLDVLRRTINYYYNPAEDYRSLDQSLKKKDLTIFRFSENDFVEHIQVSKEEGIYILSISYFINDELIDLASKNRVHFNWHFVIIDGVAHLYNSPGTYQLTKLMAGRQELKYMPKNKNDFYQLISNLEKTFTIHRDESLAADIVYAKKLKKSIKLKELGQYVLFCPFLSNGKKIFNILNVVPKEDKGKVLLPEIEEVEAFRNLFDGLHSNFGTSEDDISFRHLHRDSYIKGNWHLLFFEKCKENKITIEGLDTFKNIRFSRHKAEIESELTSKIDWFELNVVLTFGDEKVERKKWIKAIKDGQSYVELSDGTLGIIPEEWLAKMTKMIALSEVSKDGLKINKLRYNVLDELYDEIKDKSVLAEIKAKRALLESYNTRGKKKLPKELLATLRPYQEESYQWLRFLESSGFGGILADDMGLGKTLQIITLLASAKEEGNCQALVIVPKSLVFNWVNELTKFYPGLSHYIHHGNQRHETAEQIEETNIVISTYGTVVRDIDILRKKNFSHIILDESQAIKNLASKRYKAIRLLQSPFKLCATGTPVQNNTFDLYAQASFVNPGLLGSQSYFRQNFATPIDKEGNNDASQLLLKMIHPFILRRTKDQVAQDLPDKVESTIVCEMLPHQRTMYDELKNQIRKDLLSLDDTDGQLKFKVLDGLLRLRQLCNSPLLVDKKLSGEQAKSVKIESLLYKLTEEIGDGNALVFSQFVQMLSLIRQELDARKIPYAYLDGSTSNREAVVKKFMEDEKCKIFLISIKAGNTGLNLTKAQYVFIVDPWWNPAVEAQAIDRTHRIGQNKKVFAYKMICKDTIEEKIVLLQKRKKKVATELIQTDEATFKSLNKKDLMALFD